MRKLFLLMMLCCTMIVGAQETKDVVKFLNIPVDGSKSEMIEKLKEKGFSYHSDGDYLTGEFNDKNVTLSIVTSNNKVHRIMILDNTGTNEAQIKIRFNILCDQFANNDKYFGDADTQKIPKDEDISYEMSVRKKDYQAAFFQKSDEEQLKKDLSTLLYSKYTQAELENMPDEDKKKVKEEFTKMATTFMIEQAEKKTVWFKITTDSYGQYIIAMYYDNKYNKSNGSDL